MGPKQVLVSPDGVEDCGVGSRPRHIALVSALALGCVVALFVALLATRTPAVDKQARSPLLGHPAPSLAGSGLDGKSTQLSSLRGKYVLVNFFATWCIPCQREHPELQRFVADHAARGDAAVFAVIFDDTASDAGDFMRQNGGNWPVVDDPNGTIALDFGVRGPPESFLVNPGGIVIAKFIGQVSAGGLDKLVAQAEATSS
jgi:cytochrome c biogenesis protein CcmG, thiol:disulfide interchange protein DsbE